MPTYEYRCKSCDHRFEVWQKMADEPLKICPECEGTIRRVLFPAGIVFKGSGFYKTDHGTSKVVNENATTTAENAKENATKAEGTAKTESTGESKTETKAAAEKTAAPAPASESKVSTPVK